jgi:hypothetical protein
LTRSRNPLSTAKIVDLTEEIAKKQRAARNRIAGSSDHPERR